MLKLFILFVLFLGCCMFVYFHPFLIFPVFHMDLLSYRDESTFAVTVFNSNSRQLTNTVTIPYYSKQVMVKNATGGRVPVQVGVESSWHRIRYYQCTLVVEFQLVKTFQVESLNNDNRAPYELLLPVEVGPLGYATYIVDNSTSV